MASQNPQSPLPLGVVEETFGKGILNTSLWAITTSGTAYGANTPLNVATYSSLAVSLDSGMLRLSTTQVSAGGSNFTTSSSKVSSVSNYGYGTYVFSIRAPSTSAQPTVAGTIGDGTLTRIAIGEVGSAYISAVIQSTPTGGASNQILVSATANGSTVSTASVINQSQENGFSELKIVWAVGKLAFYVNGVLATTFTTNVPSADGLISFIVAGANNVSFGGGGQVGTRYGYISHFAYLPPANIIFINTNLGLGLTISSFFTPVSGDIGTDVNISTALSLTSTLSVTPTVVLDLSAPILISTPLSVVSNFRAAAIVVGTVVAANTGWLNPTAIAPTGWLNPTNILSSDNVRTTVTIGDTGETPELFVYGFAGLSIPEGASIKGISVKVEGSQTGVTYSYFRLIDVNTFLPYSATSKTLTLTGSETSITMGGATDVWGGLDTSGDSVADRVWAAADFSSTFGFWGAFGGSAGATVSLDNLQLKVDYETSTGSVTSPISGNTGWCGAQTSSSAGWTNPDAIFAIDGTRATATATAGVAGNETPTMRAFNFNGLTVPAGATINGVEVRIAGGGTGFYSGAPSGSNNYWLIGDSSGTVNSVNYRSLTSPNLAPGIIIGGIADLWGGKVGGGTWTPSDFGPNFMVYGAFNSSIGSTYPEVDLIETRITYTTGGGVDPTGDPTTLPAGFSPIALPAKLLATYFTGWQNSGLTILDVPTSYNQIYLFHSVPQGSTGAFYCQYLSAFTPQRVQAVRAKGIRCVLTVGGANAGFNFSTRAQSDAFIASFKVMFTQLGGVDGCDFNNFEAGVGSSSTEMIYISTQLKAFYGANFSISAPPAHYSTQDQGLCSTWAAAGVLDYVAPQIYDDPTPGVYTQSVMYNATQKWVAVMGNQNRVVMGTGSNYIYGATVATNVAAWNQLKASYPTMRGVMAWSAQDDFNAGTPWSFGSQMRAVL